MSFKFRTVAEQNVFRTARLQGVATADVVDTIRKLSLPWASETDKSVAKINEIRDAYKAGLVAGRLKLATDKDGSLEKTIEETYELAAAIIAKRPFKADAEDSDERRTPAEHAAVRTADSMWSQACKQAGRPATKKGKNSDKKAVKSTANASDGEPKGNGVLLPISKPTSYSDAVSFALRMRDLMERYIAVNQEHVKLDDIGTLFRDYCAKAGELAKSDIKEAA